MSSDEEDTDCPLCMEELDIADRNFRPCSCGYQICRFCWHHIKTNLNGRCPACRRLYSEQIVEFIPVSAEEVMRLKKEKKEKDRQTREMRDPSRRQLSSIRVVQKNLVYVLGMSLKHAYLENEIFKKYGKVDKVVISKRLIGTANASAGIYVTFAKKEDAGKAIEGLNGTEIDGKTVRASFGTTKYCTYYLRHMACPNPNCMYLHEPGDDVDSYNKDTVALGKHSTSNTTTVYPNKKPATVTKTEPPKVLPETKPHTTPRTWAPIPKVVPIPPVVEPEEPAPVIQSPAKEKPKNASNALLKPSKSSTSKKATSSSIEKPKKIIKPIHLEEEDKPALPATASWAKAQPAPPPENIITPTHFGPSLSDAVQTLQKPKNPPSMKAKKEKKGKGRMVRLEEFEESKRPAQSKSSQDEIHEVQSEHVSIPEDEPAFIDTDVEEDLTPAEKDSAVVEKDSVVHEVEMSEKEDDTENIVEEEQSNTKMDEVLSVEEQTLEDVESSDMRAHEDFIINQQRLEDAYQKERANQAAKAVEDHDILPEAQQDAFEDEEEDDKEQVLASLNESVIKAFDPSVISDVSIERPEDIKQDDHSSEPTSSGLSERIPSPLVAMERLSTLVKQEISPDTPQQPVMNNFLPPPPPPPQEMLDAPFAEHRRQPMPPPGLAGPPILPEWMNRGFDPFNGQDPSLIAVRRLQHSQRMMEASGLFGVNNGFPQHRPPPPPPPSVSPFGFHPNFNEGFSHQPPPPFANMLARPPPPHHPMMRPLPPQDRVNMQHFGGPLPHHLPVDDARLRAEFNAMNLNGGNREDFRSRENLRALLPNVNISFNNNQQQQKMDSSQLMQQQQRRMDQIHDTPNNHPMGPPPGHPMKFHPNENMAFYRQESFGQQNMEERLSQNPDVRTEAQNFFGEFLRKAASHQQEAPSKKEEEYTRTENPLMFQDPAIMSVRLTENPMNESNQSAMLQILGGQPGAKAQEQQQTMQQRHGDPRFAMNGQRMNYSEPGFDERQQFGNMFGFPPPLQQQQMFNQNMQPPPQFIPRFLEPSINTMGHTNPMMRPPMMLFHQGDNRFRNTGNMHPGE